jgi:hypothetical protein
MLRIYLPLLMSHTVTPAAVLCRLGGGARIVAYSIAISIYEIGLLAISAVVLAAETCRTATQIVTYAVAVSIDKIDLLACSAVVLVRVASQTAAPVVAYPVTVGVYEGGRRSVLRNTLGKGVRSPKTYNH